MANIENNKNNKKPHRSIPENIDDGVEQVKEVISDAVHHPVETAEAFVDQAKKDVVSVKWWGRLLQILFWSVLFLLISVFVIINLPVTKNWAAKKVTDKFLNKELKTNVSFKNVDIDYFGNITINEVVIKDYKNFPFIHAKQLYADSDWFSIISNSRNLQFQSLSLKEMDMKVITYKGDSIANFIRFVNLFDDGKPRDPKKTPFELKSRIYITNSKISIINQNQNGEEGKWLNAKDVSLIVPELHVKGADVFARINNLRFTTERWGKKHYVDTFSGDFNYTKKFLSLKDLTFNTGHSLLQGDIKFNINNGSWADFTNKVRWDMNLKSGSQISGYDISYFATKWDNYKPINISGAMNGTLNKFLLSNFLMGDKEVNIRTETMKLTNLLDGKFIIETNTLSTDFTYKALKAMLPKFISEKMKNFADDFGRLKYNGAARVMPEQIFVPKGSLVTGIGRANISNFYLTDYSTNLPKYKGYADVYDLNTSVITKNKQVGLITGKFNIDGQSFDVNTMKIKTKSQIAKIEILDKEINNLYLDGVLDHRIYNGIINVNDEQAKANVKGLIDFRTSRILADITSDINHLNINYFTGGKGKQVMSGKIVGKIAMTNINDMDLDAELNELNFANDTQKFYIPNAKIKAFFENGNRVVSVDAPDAVSGKITGRYELGDLVGMVQNGLKKILVGPAPRKLYRGQYFNMEFDVKQGLLNYFLQDIKIPKGAFVNGSYDGNANNLVLNIDTEELKYYMTKQKDITDADKALAESNPDYIINPRDLVTKDSAMINNIVLRINTANLEEQIFAKIDRAEYNKNIFKDITLTARNDNNQKLHIATNFLHGNLEQETDGNMKPYAININQSTNEDGDYVIRFDPTDLKFNNVAWKIDTNTELNHAITYRKKTEDFLIENLRLYSDNSELFVKNAIFKSAKDFEADAEIKNLEIAKILEMQDEGNSLNIKGFANGTIHLKMDKNNLEPLIDVKVDNITMNNDHLGDIIINAKNSAVPNVFDISAKVVSAGIIGGNNLDVTGTINNNTPSPTLDIKANMKDFDLKFANQFVKGVFSNMRGKANGILNISGTMKDIDYSGDIALNKLGLKLDFTGVDYSFDDTIIQLNRGSATLNNIGIKDGRNNSRGSISGIILFNTLSSMAVELLVRADNLMLLNTAQKDFDLFWGKVYGEGGLFVSGPVSGLSIETRDMKVLNNSIFTFNSNSTSTSEEFKMLRFLKEDNNGVISLEEKAKSGANMNVDFNFAVDKGTTVNVLVGDDVGDISVRGIAKDLKFVMNRNGSIEMNGSYMVDNGTFISKVVQNKIFQIVSGSTIRWDGDAMTPSLDIAANYTRNVSNIGDYLGVGYLPPINVVLETKITQTLNNPNVEFGISALDVSSQIKETLAAKVSQEDEKIIQFGSILLFSRFNTTASGFDVGNIAEVTGVNMAFKQLGSIINNFSNQLQFDFDYVGGDAASNTKKRANAGLRVAFSPRIKVKTGLGIPLSKSTEETQQNYISGEGTVEWDISKKNDGSLILRGYSKPMNIGMGTGNLGISGASNQTYGGGIVWSKSFNTIFKKTKKDKNSNKSKDENKVESEKKDTIK